MNCTPSKKLSRATYREDNNRFNELDAFRGIAAMAVVLYHYFYRYDQLYGHDVVPVQWSQLGLYGVHFFFLISGFVIYWSLHRTTALSGFLFSRFSRIFPAYWAAALIIFTVVAIAGLPGRETGLTELAINVTMIQEYLNVAHVDQAFWTLTTELTFYFWFVVIFLTGRLNHAEYWFVPFMLLGVASDLELLEMPLRLSKALLVTHANLFAAGIVFYRLYTGTSGMGAWPLLILSIAVNFAIYPWMHACFIASFYGVFYLAVIGKLRWLCTAPLIWLGGISYTLYLLHQNIGYVIIRSVYSLGGSGWFGIALALLVVLGLANMLSHFVERPATRWLRARFAK